jgi:fucose permease
MYMIIGFGSGIQNAAWNAWIGNMVNSNEVLGFLPGFYGVGATCSHFIATTVITKAGWEWFAFHYFLSARK